MLLRMYGAHVPRFFEDAKELIMADEAAPPGTVRTSNAVAGAAH